MFKTIEQEKGSGGPQWLSDHPNPGNRYEYIMQEAQTLQVRDPVRDSRSFEQMQARLGRMSAAPTTEEATRSAAGRGVSSSPENRPRSRRERAWPRLRHATRRTKKGTCFASASVELARAAGSNVVTFAPEGAYGTADGQSAFTHGVQIGLARNETHDLQTATAEFIDALAAATRG